jgi:hypothetical protein
MGDEKERITAGNTHRGNRRMSVTFSPLEAYRGYSRSRGVSLRCIGLIAFALSAGQIVGSNAASAQYNPQQERRVSDQRISPTGRYRATCPTFIRGERVTDKEMKSWRQNPACKYQVREYDNKRRKASAMLSK